MRHFLTALLLASSFAHAQEKRPAFTIPDSTLSPDRRHGVTVPALDSNPTESNELVETATGKTLASIKANPFFDRMNHETLLPSRWSKDGKILLWEVDGKWFPHALVLLKIETGKVSQFNLLELARKAILTETKKAAPDKYETARKANSGNGSAYPDGFSVDVDALEPVALPLRLRIALTSNPKGTENFPTLESSMDAILTAEGTLEITDFKMEPGVSRHF
ncbi:MAG: hypothetical protein EOP87_21460 [Verrucomicrobiaceae bacterium]|nr:MAG: hypothetical protein EOP87_21460 [Verrucomicrobiaceae bacterium]